MRICGNTVERPEETGRKVWDLQEVWIVPGSVPDKSHQKICRILCETYGTPNDNYIVFFLNFLIFLAPLE